MASCILESNCWRADHEHCPSRPQAFIYKATKQHAFNLMKFVSLYKTLLLIQKRVNGGKERGAFLQGHRFRVDA